MMSKQRIDKLLLERGLAPTRERAQAMVLAGRVLVNEQKVEKAGQQVAGDAQIRLLGEDPKYVSRGGLKLEKALEHWKLDVSGQVVMDVGASTGGFTDCLLQHGAAKVVAVDTGYGQMDAVLRKDPRVKLLEKTNARYLKADDVRPLLSGEEQVQLVAMDVSFISATLVLPAVLQSVLPAGSAGLQLIVLVKPQFEAGREKVGKGGIVRDAAAQEEAVAKVRRAVEELGGKQLDVIASPILGSEGNKEYLLHAVVS